MFVLYVFTIALYMIYTHTYYRPRTFDRSADELTSNFSHPVPKIRHVTWTLCVAQKDTTTISDFRSVPHEKYEIRIIYTNIMRFEWRALFFFLYACLPSSNGSEMLESYLYSWLGFFFLYVRLVCNWRDGKVVGIGWLLTLCNSEAVNCTSTWQLRLKFGWE